MRILVVEDETKVASFIQRGLEAEHYTVDVASDGDTGLARALEGHHDLLILDLMLPGRDGAAVLRELRARRHTLPILLLTARATVVDKVRGLDLGADDYLTKPFDHLELFARLRALVRRAGDAPAPESADFTAGDLALDFALHEVRLRGEVLALSPLEYLLLLELVRHAGRVLPHQYLLEQVWGADHARDVRYLKEFVGRLRRKLGDDAAHPRYIETIWGTGYRFLLPP